MKKKDNNTGSSSLLIDTQLERAFLVSLLTDVYSASHYKALQGVIMDNDFTDEDHRKMWKVVQRCADDLGDISPLNIYAKGKEMGVEVDLKRYLSRDSIYADSESMGSMLHNLGQRRRLAEQVEDIYLSLIYDEEKNTAQCIAMLDQAVKDSTSTSQKNCETFGEVYQSLLQQTQDKANGLVPQGVNTGFSLIDNKGGLEYGELMVVAGRNSNGKTSLALCMALAAAEQGVPVGIFSLEMTNVQLTARLTSLLTGINGESIKRGTLTDDEWGRFVSVDDAAPIYFDKRRSMDADTLVSNIKAMVAQMDVKVVVVDYLQLLRGKGKDRHQQMGGIAHTLEAVSKQLGICIILLSQLRRNQPNDPLPRLEELKESGDIADAADSIYMVYRPERHGADIRFPDMSQNWSEYSTQGTALLICYKNRMGAMQGEQLLGFDAPTTRFYEREQYELMDNANALPQAEDIFK